MIAHFVDIDCLVSLGGNAWIVDKSSPDVPIMKISRSDFNLYRGGVYRSQGNRVDFNGRTFWLPEDVYGRLKVKLKNRGGGLGSLAISMQEFMNKELVDNIPYEVRPDMVAALRNLTDDIYIVCPRMTRRTHASIIARLTEELATKGVKPKKFYHISESFHNQTEDYILFRKARLYIQHLVGHRTDGDKFTDDEVKMYSRIEVHDDSMSILSVAREMNDTLRRLLQNTQDSVARVVRENVDESRPEVTFNWHTGNSVNPVVTERVRIDYSSVIRHFESFVPRWVS